jgi:glycosyltransferase involved in cell wall biosynthesis
MLSDDGFVGRLRVLYLVHALPPSEFTGTPLVAYEYAKRAANRGWKTTVISADPTVAAWGDVGETREVGEWFSRIAVPRTQPGTWAVLAPSTPRQPGSPATKFFVETLRRFAPDLVHVVDNVHLPLDWPELAAEAGIPIIRTVSSPEDLCALIPPVSPLSGPAGFCAAPLTAQTCAACVDAVYGADFPWPQSGPGEEPGRSDRPGWILRHLEVKRSRAESQFGSVFDRMVFSNRAWRRYFEETLPLDPAKTRVIDMGMDLGPWRGVPATRAKGPGEPVELVLAGSLHPARGQIDAVRAFSRPELARRSDYRLRFLGGGDPDMLAGLLEVNPRVEVLGAYEPTDLPALLSSADAGLSTSLFETFHRVSREYLLAGLPVVANPTFGIDGLVVDGENGLLYDRTSPDGLASAVCSLLDDRALLAHLTAGAVATRPRIRSLDDEMAEMAELYREVVLARPRPARPTRRWPLRAARR